MAAVVFFNRERVGIMARHDQSNGHTMLQVATGNDFSVSAHEETIYFFGEKTPTEEQTG